MTRSPLVFAILLATIAMARADVFFDGVGALSAGLGAGTVSIGDAEAEVTTLGPARQGGQAGSYRMLVLRGQSLTPAGRLFVQWIAAGRVQNTLEIREFSALGTSIDAIRGKIEGNELSVFIQTGKIQGAPILYELFVNGPEKYRF